MKRPINLGLDNPAIKKPRLDECPIITQKTTGNPFNYSFYNDTFHIPLFQRCMEIMINSTDQTLLKLRRVNKYYAEQIDHFIFKYLESTYQSDSPITFSFFKCFVETPFRLENFIKPPLHLYHLLNIAFMFYIYAERNRESIACLNYICFFKGHLQTWIEGCIKSHFQFSEPQFLVTTMKYSTEGFLENDNYVIKLNRKRPQDAYFLIKFLEEYSIDQFLLYIEMNDRNKIQSIIYLLKFLRHYKSYEYFDKIKSYLCLLIDSIKQYSSANLNPKGIELCLHFLSEIRAYKLIPEQCYNSVLLIAFENAQRNNLLKKKGLSILGFHMPQATSMPIGITLNELISVAIDNIHSHKHKWSAFKILYSILQNLKMTIPKEELMLWPSLIIKNIRSARPIAQEDGLSLLNILINKDIPLSENDLNILLDFIAQNLLFPWDCRWTAKKLLKSLLRKGFSIPKEIISMLPERPRFCLNSEALRLDREAYSARKILFFEYKASRPVFRSERFGSTN